MVWAVGVTVGSGADSTGDPAAGLMFPAGAVCLELLEVVKGLAGGAAGALDAPLELGEGGSRSIRR